MVKFAPPRFLRNIANGRNVLLLLGLFITFSGIIMPSMEADIKALSGGVGVIDLQFFYTPADALSMLSAYGPQGIHLYLIAQWTVDLIFPIIGGFFFATSLIWLDTRYWWWLGLMLTLADWTENIFITLMLLKFPEFSASLAIGSCFFTVLKWATVFFANGLVLFYGGKKLLAWQSSSRLEKASAASSK